MSGNTWSRPTTGFESTASGFSTTVTHDTGIIQDTKNSADSISARHGQFEEVEKTRTTELNFLPSKNNILRKKIGGQKKIKKK